MWHTGPTCVGVHSDEPYQLLWSYCSLWTYGAGVRTTQAKTCFELFTHVCCACLCMCVSVWTSVFISTALFVYVKMFVLVIILFVYVHPHVCLSWPSNNWMNKNLYLVLSDALMENWKPALHGWKLLIYYSICDLTGVGALFLGLSQDIKSHTCLVPDCCPLYWISGLIRVGLLLCFSHDNAVRDSGTGAWA